jgi:hypothetical protein
MDKDDLFAELLFNKTKVKALSALSPAVSNVDVNKETSSVYSELTTELQSIFTQYEAVIAQPEEFIAFIKDEMPAIVLRFQKLCNGKKD